MKIKIVDKRENESDINITKDELERLHNHFYSYNVAVDDDTALSILDDRIYYDIRKWDIDDTGVREELSERVSKLLMDKYRGKYQGFPQEDWRKAVDEIVIVTELNGFKKYPESQNKDYKIPQEFREEIEDRYNDQNKNNFESPSINFTGTVFVGGRGSGKSINDPDHSQYEGFVIKDEVEKDGFFKRLLDKLKFGI